MSEEIEKDLQQEENIHPLGALTAPIDIRDYYLPAGAQTTTTTYPKEFVLEGMPPVKDQGKIWSCVAHALSTVVEYHNKHQEETDVTMSTGYIYGNRDAKDEDIKGMYTTHALKRLVKYGDVPEELFPYNQEIPQILTTFKSKAFEISPDAIPNRISSYYSIAVTGLVKKALMADGPVICNANWSGKEKVDADGVVYEPSTVKDSDYGGHCTVIYGWNEKGFLVQNSWGTKWGKEGRCILPYDFHYTGFYGVKDEINEKKKATELTSLNEKLAEYERRIVEQNATIATLEDKIGDLEMIQTENEIKLKQQMVDTEKLLEANKKLNELQDKYNALYLDYLEGLKTAEELDKARKTLEEKQHEMEAMMEELGSLRSTANAYILATNELEKLKSTKTSLELANQELIEDNEALKKRIEELEQKITDIEKPYQNMPKWLVNIINFIVNLFKKESEPQLA